MKLHPLLENPNAVLVFRMSVSDTPGHHEFRGAAERALSMMQISLDGERVVLKPNVTSGELYADPESGITTHPQFIQGAVEGLQRRGAGKIHILEDPKNSNTNEPRSWEGTGYLEVSEETGAQLRCAVSYNCTRRKVPNPLVHRSLTVSRLAVSPNTVLINVPKLKTHNLAVTTLCMKNMMGVVYAPQRHYCRQAWLDIPAELRTEDRERSADLDKQLHMRWQEGLAKRLVDTASVVRPDLNIVEGVVGRDGTGFRRGSNFPLGLVIAGVNMVAVDSVASYIMGFDPASIIYLNIAAESGLGVNNLSKIDVFVADRRELRKCGHIEELRRGPQFGLISSLPGEDTLLNVV